MRFAFREKTMNQGDAEAQRALVKGIFEDSGDLRVAIARLGQAGIAQEQMEVISAEPGSGEMFLPVRKKTRIGAFALTGGLLGAAGGFLLSTLTALAYPLPTGGMPILSWWPIGIVTYEAMMLGAILATLLGLLVELRLPNLRSLPYHNAVADGGFLLIVCCPDPAQSARTEQIVVQAGGTKV
jgi:Protein of unknown function (DUF3341)